MKHLLTSLLLLLAPAMLSAADFEGRIALKMTSGRDKTQDIAYNIKGDKMRLELPNQQGAGMIMDMGKKEMTMIMEQQKMYMTMAMPEPQAQEKAQKKSDVKVEKTGETETILGYLAQKFIVTDGNNKTEMWLAQGLGTFMSFNQGNPMARGRGPAPQGWEKAMAGMEGSFPLRIVGKDFKMEATAIDKKPLPDSMFAPPAGYQKFDMGGMMRGMIPGAK